MKLNNQNIQDRKEYTVSEKQALLAMAGISTAVAFLSAAIVTYSSSRTDDRDVAMVLSHDRAPLVEMETPSL